MERGGFFYLIQAKKFVWKVQEVDLKLKMKKERTLSATFFFRKIKKSVAMSICWSYNVDVNCLGLFT
jgi:hypothetical protein